MNFIFRSYPSHPWFAEWTFEARNCSSSFRENNANRFFQSQETVGRIIPNTADPDWALQIPVPQNGRTNMLFNGFCSYFETKKKKLGAEVIIPEAGVLWGRFEDIPSPVLATDLPVREDADFQWLETDAGGVFLLVRDQHFCLTTKALLLSDAQKIADSYLEQDLEVKLIEELDIRSGAQNLFEEMSHHDALAVISAESMMKALRPPEGSIPLAWCQASSSDSAQMDINEIHPLALAWKLMDIETAEELLLCALKVQTNAGAIPVHYAPYTTHSVMEAPKPMLAKTTERVWDVRKNEEFLSAVFPLLRRHIQWLLNHFDPKRRGIHCWILGDEALVPQDYQSDLATVDLSALLITEIDALNRLGSHLPSSASNEICFEKERGILEQNLLDQFWNSEENAFVNSYLKDKPKILRGFSSFTPLIWKALPHTNKINILEKVHESGKLPGGLSVLSWRKSAMDDHSFPLLQQLLVLQALQISDPHGQLLNDFSRITLQGFVEWHTLALEEEKRLPINTVTAAYIMCVQAIRQYRYRAQGTESGFFFKLMRKIKLDRFELAVLGATIFTVISVHLIYRVIKAPPAFSMLEAQMNSAYASRNVEGTLQSCMAIINYYPDNAEVAMQLAANISMLRGNFSQASDLYERVRKQYPDSPGPMIALGLAYQLQGRFEEAENNYYEFCYIFDEIFPSIVSEVNHFRLLMQEGFEAPPKWQEMYRYQLMHEL
ncbi:hypothetical protein P4C99_14890 [Pontiellaceae bacterium B1224]|nr:hypothetical protein [Pontiellaceae bacterium B1224]